MPTGAGADGARRRRNTELVLVLFAVLTAAFADADAECALHGGLPGAFALQVCGLGAVAVLAHLAVRRFAPYADPLILPLAVFLSGLGLVLLHRLDISYAAKYKSVPVAGGQVMWLCIGVAAFIAVTVGLKHHRILQRYTYVLMAGALVLLAAPAFFPGDTYGAKRWIRLGGFSFEPDEFTKLVITIFFAGYLTVQRDALALASRRVLGMYLPRGRNLGPVVAIWAASLLVLIFERDLGTSLIFFGIFVVMLYVATERTSWVVIGLLLATVGAGVVGSMEPHVHGRVVAWLHPMDIYLPHPPPGLISEQGAQAMFSFGSGGILGSGLGQGYPWLIGFAGRSDFILTTVGEELGAAGVLALLLVYALLAERGLRTALVLTDPFGKLLAAGLSAALVLQVFVVAGGASGLIPLTGKALPFLAQGGSSMLANWLLVALLLKLSDAAGRTQLEPGPDPDGTVTLSAEEIRAGRALQQGIALG
ncbi:FtsW/RodA/SpoVE family cell cycle protein [Streptomyces morookaense]|uniref:FtsW/RodA/SpoVE family cell cycle protein n=1 Tax=Streptomyces TaxID=1883 RepID=UPI001D123669|nr:FtsW/RodA/SpoVE family cell cycle protein [Streptomyces sp. ET3-23]MCC2274235.1 FtsW/RodA/SpoVE family cell cycle protein [Streptomyces sp. ET3-23]